MDVERGIIIIEMNKKYRSKLESEVAKKLGKGFEYEPSRIEYWQLKNYTPDFVLGKYYIEVKGFFRPGDQSKYKAIKEQFWNEGLEFIFLFQNSNKKVRKGAKLTMGEWATKNGIKWFDLKEINELKRYVRSK